MKHVISLLVENHEGVLSRISGLFSGRGYNLDSLTVGITNDPTISRITLVCLGDDAVIEQIKKQLNKLIDVIKVLDLTRVEAIHRELALIKVGAKASQRSEIFQVTDVFRGKILDVGSETMTIEVTGTQDKIDAFITLVSEYTIIEIARSGMVSLERGKKVQEKAVK